MVVMWKDFTTQERDWKRYALLQSVLQSVLQSMLQSVLQCIVHHRVVMCALLQSVLQSVLQSMLQSVLQCIVHHRVVMWKDFTMQERDWKRYATLQCVLQSVLRIFLVCVAVCFEGFIVACVAVHHTVGMWKDFKMRMQCISLF